jgi:type II secretory pathway component GspD/PulD (secretin)
MKRRQACLALALLAVLATARAEPRLEIVTLRHRPAEQILPALQPLVEPGGALSNMGDKLLLRVSPANLAELRVAIDALDTPLRRLVVSVRQDQDAAGQGGGAGVNARLSPGNSRVIVDAGVGSTSRNEQLSQQVQVVEGGRALIRVGQSLPIAMREWRSGPNGWQAVDSVRFLDVGSGFMAAPQLIGEQVSIAITPAVEQLRPDGSIESTRLSTQVRGRLGEWIPLGGSHIDSRRSEYGTTGIRQGDSQSRGQVWLRVDALD